MRLLYDERTLSVVESRLDKFEQQMRAVARAAYQNVDWVACRPTLTAPRPSAMRAMRRLAAVMIAAASTGEMLIALRAIRSPYRTTWHRGHSAAINRAAVATFRHIRMSSGLAGA